MTGESVLELIADRQDRMRPSERKVAAAVLADPGAVVHMAMAGLAEAAGVSEPTVMRFCTALGFGGFQAFRLALAQALVLGPPTAQAAITPDDPVDALAGAIFGHALRGLDRARRHLDPAALAAAVDALVGARAVHFVGLGAAGVVAQDAAGHAVAFGVPCTAPADLHRQYATAAACRPGDVVVAICPTGRTGAVVEVAGRAKRAGAAVVAVTGGPGPLAELADVAIVLRAFDDPGDAVTPAVGRLAGLVLVDVLATAVAARRGPAHLQRVREAGEALAALEDPQRA